MSTENATKINQLLASQPPGVVLQSFWLTERGYSLDLQKRYRKGKWLDSIGNGAMIRAGDLVTYEGGIYALQHQTTSNIHPGGRTALSLLGNAHYLELSIKKVTLFGNSGETLPAWFQKYHWDVAIDYHQASFLPAEVGLVDVDFKTFTIKVSSAVRAIMECLYLAPQKQELLECYEIMQGLNNLRPNQVQRLLETCQSVKVKRLFLYLAEKAGHQWFGYLDLKKVDLGSGKRSLVMNGSYISKYQITVPKELDEYEKRSV